MSKIPTGLQTNLDAVRTEIAGNVSKYSLSNPYGSTARKTAKGTTITAKVIGIIFGAEQKIGENSTIPVYVVTDKKTRCKISAEELNALSIGSTVTMVKSEDMIEGVLRHWFTFDAIVSNPEVVTAGATAETATA